MAPAAAEIASRNIAGALAPAASWRNQKSEAARNRPLSGLRVWGHHYVSFLLVNLSCISLLWWGVSRARYIIVAGVIVFRLFTVAVASISFVMLAIVGIGVGAD